MASASGYLAGKTRREDLERTLPEVLGRRSVRNAFELTSKRPVPRAALKDVRDWVADLYNLGFIDGRASIGPLLAETQNAADRYYRRAFDRDFRQERGLSSPMTTST